MVVDDNAVAAQAHAQLFKSQAVGVGGNARSGEHEIVLFAVACAFRVGELNGDRVVRAAAVWLRRLHARARVNLDAAFLKAAREHLRGLCVFER